MGKAVAKKKTGAGALAMSVAGHIRDNVSKARETATSAQRGTVQYARLKKNGRWVFGQGQSKIHPKDRWAVFVHVIGHGYVCWGDNKLKGEAIVPMSSDRPNVVKLKNHGEHQWRAAIRFIMVNISEPDLVISYTASTIGGRKAADSLLEALGERASNKKELAFVPVLKLKREAYQHKEHGEVYEPILKIMDWITFEELEKLSPELVGTAEERPGNDPEDDEDDIEDAEYEEDEDEDEDADEEDEDEDEEDEDEEDEDEEDEDEEDEDEDEDEDEEDEEDEDEDEDEEDEDEDPPFEPTKKAKTSKKAKPAKSKPAERKTAAPRKADKAPAKADKKVKADKKAKPSKKAKTDKSKPAAKSGRENRERPAGRSARRVE